MISKYDTENEIEALVAAFESGTIARDEWRHAEHLVVALYYVAHHDFAAACAKMRGGIFNLLRAFGVDLDVEMPYHETLTMFWMRAVADFRYTRAARPLHEICAEMIGLFDKDYPLRFYSRERLFSDEARARLIEADLKQS